MGWTMPTAKVAKQTWKDFDDRLFSLRGFPGSMNAWGLGMALSVQAEVGLFIPRRLKYR